MHHPDTYTHHPDTYTLTMREGHTIVISEKFKIDTNKYAQDTLTVILELNMAFHV